MEMAQFVVLGRSNPDKTAPIGFEILCKDTYFFCYGNFLRKNFSGNSIILMLFMLSKQISAAKTPFYGHFCLSLHAIKEIQQPH